MLGPRTGLVMGFILFAYILGSSIAYVRIPRCSLVPAMQFASSCRISRTQAPCVPTRRPLPPLQLIILGDCFQPLLASILGEGSWLAQRDTVIGLISTVFILPLCFPRTLTALAGALLFCLAQSPLDHIVAGSVRLVMPPWLRSTQC